MTASHESHCARVWVDLGVGMLATSSSSESCLHCFLDSCSNSLLAPLGCLRFLLLVIFWLLLHLSSCSLRRQSQWTACPSFCKFSPWHPLSALDKWGRVALWAQKTWQKMHREQLDCKIGPYYCRVVPLHIQGICDKSSKPVSEPTGVLNPVEPEVLLDVLQCHHVGPQFIFLFFFKGVARRYCIIGSDWTKS